jgi:trehalose 6-phosphate synthase
VNERFAETVSPLIEQDDLIWVHDYHLIPLGAQLRERGLKNRMGFFLHIPFPPSRLMVSLPFHEGLVLSLLAYDVIGFQTEEWLESFRHYVSRELGGHCEPDGTIHVGERSVHAAAYPIGIDYKEFSEAAGSEASSVAFDRLKQSAADKRIIIGVDRPGLFQGARGALSRLPPLPGRA